MAHGGYGKRRVAGRPPFSGGGGGVNVGGGSGGGSGGGGGGGGGSGRDRDRTNQGQNQAQVARKEREKKAKIVSIKNQIRSVERLLKKPLLSEVKDAQEKRLENLKKQAELHARCELERKMSLRYRRVKFFERRKIERRIRRLEKQLRSASDVNGGTMDSHSAVSQQLAQLAEDLEYVRFFPKTEKYISLFVGSDDETVRARRDDLRVKIKANLAAAVAAGVDLEETGSEDDATAMSDDDFFMAGSSGNDADADDELTDKSPRLGDEKDDTSREVIPVPQTPQNARPRLWKGGDKAKGTVSNPNDWRQKSGKASMVAHQPRLPNRAAKPGTVRQWSSSSGNNKRVAKKPRIQPGRTTRANVSDENARPRNWTTSSHSSEILKGSSTSDVPQQPKKRKRTRSKKKK